MSSVDSAIATLVNRLEKVTQRLESVEKQLATGPVAPAQSSSGGSVSSASVQEYEDLVNQFIAPYVSVSQTIGAEVAQQAEFVLNAVNAQKEFLRVAAGHKKPSDSVLQALIKPTADNMGKVVEIKEKSRSKFPNHLAAVSEGIAALGWVLVSPTPGPHVADMRGGSEFWSNKILKEFKGVNQTHVDWVQHFNGFLKELQTFIKKHHTTGVTWNPRGEEATASSVAAASASSDSSAPPPPGPPPPPAVEFIAPAANATPDMSNIFAALNKGEGVTTGLKKVTNDMKSKNRTDKTSVVPAKESKAAAGPKSGARDWSGKPSKFSLEGNKWVVEYQVDNKSVVIGETDMKQTVYIYRCKGSVIQIKGKVNSVTLDECSKTSVVFENIVASFDVVNCNGVEVQVLGKVPTFAVDKTSGCQIYLSKDSLESEIVTSKSSEMNVLFPDNTEELVEVPIPEQYKSQVKKGKLVTEVLTHV
jgi:adenylyl cyclase-associated protein